MSQNLRPFVQYSIGLQEVNVGFTGGSTCPVPEVLSNGRASYVIFETLVRFLTGLRKTTRSDHVGPDGSTYEQKAYVDEENFDAPSSARRTDFFQTSASSTFGANNNGPIIKRFLESGDYGAALQICKDTGYSKNDFYIYTNTRGFSPVIPFRYVIIPTQEVLANLSTEDPRQISRAAVLSLVTERVEIQLPIAR